MVNLITNCDIKLSLSLPYPGISLFLSLPYPPVLFPVFRPYDPHIFPVPVFIFTLPCPYPLLVRSHIILIFTQSLSQVKVKLVGSRSSSKTRTFELCSRKPGFVCYKLL